MTTEETTTFENFKARVLNDVDNFDIANELGYVYKRAMVDIAFKNDTYWTRCYYWIKSLAIYYNVKCMC